MSVSGLYDSDIGDKLARKTLGLYRDPILVKVHHERKRQLCACGRELARPYIMRNGVNVCTKCAESTPKAAGGHRALNTCAACGKILPRVALVRRKGKLYCKQCKTAF